MTFFYLDTTFFYLPPPLDFLMLVAIVIACVVQKPSTYVVTGPILGFIAWAFSLPPCLYGLALLLTFIGIIYVLRQ